MRVRTKIYRKHRSRSQISESSRADRRSLRTAVVQCLATILVQSEYSGGIRRSEAIFTLNVKNETDIPGFDANH